MQAVAEFLPLTPPYAHDVAEFRDLSYPAYRAELRALRLHLLSLQEWVIEDNKRLAIVLEGRDAAGKGKLSADIRHYLYPKFARVVAQVHPPPKPCVTGSDAITG
jgi:polyphosphate kinase 2 (PPK2 family)